MPRLRAYVADDHPLYRGAMAGVIRGCPDFELAGMAEDGDQALSDIRRLRPDLALLDLQMPRMGGREVLRRLTSEGSPTRALLLSGLATADVASEAIAAGARGFLDKQATAEELCAAMTAVARGETVVSPRLKVHSAVALTPREIEVLALVAEGFTAPQIAEQLVLSPHTVKTHVRNLCDKLGVPDRAAAVASAIRRGLL